MHFEEFPDEILLEICQYLSSSDVLYSLFNLNSRLTRTIHFYRQYVVLRRTTFTQFEYLCSNVLPKIGSTIRSLCINANWTDLLAKRFLFYFRHQMKTIFPNIEHLILVALSGNELEDYLESIDDLPYLTKLTIHDRYNVTEELKRTLFDKVLSANKNRLKTIFMNRHSESLSINHEIDRKVYSNIIDISIHLENLNDLHYIFKITPNIRQMRIVIDKQIKDELIEFDDFVLINLIEFHMESFRRRWVFDELSSLIKKMPFLKNLSLDVFSQDSRLLDGQQLLSVLPMDTLKRFNYAIDYTPEDEMESIDDITSSWSSTPYPVCCLLDDSGNHLFLHTVPYGFSYLDISSLFATCMSKKNNQFNYNVNELLLFNVLELSQIFIVLNYCRKVKDLAVEIEEVNSDLLEEEKKEKLNLALPCLNQLHWLSIDGCPSDGYLLKNILSAAPNVRMLILDMKLLLQIIEKDTDQLCISMLKNRIKHLSIQITDETELNDINIKKLSEIFINIRHFIIENKASHNVSVEFILQLLLDHFETHNLISIIIRGSVTQSVCDNPSQWLIDNTYLKNFIGQFQADCDELEFKIWL